MLDIEGVAARDRYLHDPVLARPDRYLARCGDEMPADPGDLVDRVRGTAVWASAP